MAIKKRAMLVALVLPLAAASALAKDDSGSERRGVLQITLDCSTYRPVPGSGCVIQFSNLSDIPPGTEVYYDSTPYTVTTLLDTDVVLDTSRLYGADGYRALGHCTIDLGTPSNPGPLTGLCTFHDGVGRLAGIRGPHRRHAARIAKPDRDLSLERHLPVPQRFSCWDRGAKPIGAIGQHHA